MAIHSLNPSIRDCKPAIVYVLIDPRTNFPFYVGVTTRRPNVRLSSHVNDAVHLQMRGPRYEMIRSIHGAGHRTIIAPLETVERDWPEAERFWIEYLKFLGACLTNISDGGPGRTGLKTAESTREKMRKAAAGRDLTAFHSKEAREMAASKNRHLIEVNGQTYTGIKKAASALGIKYGKLQSMLDTGRAKRLTGAKVGFVRKRHGRCRGACHPNRRSVKIDGVEYPTRRDAAAAKGVYQSTIARWLKSGRATYIDGGPPSKIGFGAQHKEVVPPGAI